jgi:hypothetical protein
MKNLIMVFVILTSGIAAFAGDKGNGGGSCESQIISIRNNIESWILRGHSKNLKFPPKLTHDQYASKMLASTSGGTVLCTNQDIYYGVAPKVCRNAEDLKDLIKFLPDVIRENIKQDGKFPNKKGWIICNRDDFMNKTSKEDLFALIHHEYAGLAGIEQNNGSLESDYTLSNQLSSLAKETKGAGLPVVKSLSCKKNLTYGFIYSALVFLAKQNGMSQKDFNRKFIGPNIPSREEKFGHLNIAKILSSIDLDGVFRIQNSLPFFMAYIENQGLFSKDSEEFNQVLIIASTYFSNKNSTWKNFVEELVTMKTFSFESVCEKKERGL